MLLSGRIWFARLFAARRAQIPNEIVIFLDPTRCDVLVAISTILSSVEITRRSSLDAVLVHVDAAELATRLATGSEVIDDSLLPAIAVADRFILGNCDNVLPHIEQHIRAELMGRSGFAKEVLGAGERCGDGGRLQAWHVAPEVRSVEPIIQVDCRQSCCEQTNHLTRMRLTSGSIG